MLLASGSVKDIGWNLEVIGTKYLVQLTELKETGNFVNECD